MTYKFRKKPVVVEAFQMTRTRRWYNYDWPEWLNAAWQKDESEVGSVSPLKDRPNKSDNISDIVINTLEGSYPVTWNDYIIKGIKGELYPCKPDIFEATYETIN